MVYNFNAGPSILPPSVLQQAAQAVLNLDNSGLSILEISHRSESFIAIIEEAKQLVRQLMQVPDNYHILFLHGGASLQFTMVPQNLLRHKALFAETGVWAKKAIAEAAMIGEAKIIASSADKNFNYIPPINITENADYLHITSNNTIYGTEFNKFPEVSIPLVCDMSSDILSRSVDVSKFALIYAGAQKNIGTAGVTLVIIRDDMLDYYKPNTPTMLRYKTHTDNASLFNTPSVFAIYVCLLTLRWLQQNGGVAEIEKSNILKASLLYNYLDSCKIFTPIANIADRSLMNVTFTINDAVLENKFISFSIEKNITGIKGHKAAGGFRASLYNALPVGHVEYLIEMMHEFEKAHC
ncbi:MAG: 3-phosphoserine/phosphohydroxythreonine transaminase [Bacteroidetes bacterium]|nr:3-phosphoserine/phosphohydroxythreonine transaminase [Bacteroidota bacterium]